MITDRESCRLVTAIEVGCGLCVAVLRGRAGGVISRSAGVTAGAPGLRTDNDRLAYGWVLEIGAGIEVEALPLC